MNYIWSSILLALLIISGPVVADFATVGEPLKKKYSLTGDGYTSFYQTGNIVESYSMICDMGQAIPDPKKTNWYQNESIAGLQFELRARAAFIGIDKKIKPMGFIVVTKHDDILLKFKPVGDYVNGTWEGDVFSSWSGEDTEIKVYSERFGTSGYAHFDLLDGNGFFYKENNRDNPDYFLSNCRRIKKSRLPEYDWK